MTNYSRITLKERCQLATFLEMGKSVDDIASHLNRHRSTIYREIKRNHREGHYWPGLDPFSPST